ncbi:MAG: hypothetical protein NVS3B14_20570 [Ktedonobacteraceae bacterium]
MFFGVLNRQAGDAPEQTNWEGWTPPWMSREGQGPRGPFGFGRGFFGGPRDWQGPRGPFGPGHGWGHHGWQGPRGPFGHGFGPGRNWGIPDELLALRSEAAEVARLFAIASHGAFENKERLSQLRAFLDRSHKELSDLIYGSARGQASDEGESASGSSDVGQA